MVHVYYLFASEAKRADKWRKCKLAAPDGKPVETWEHVRYLLESQLGFYKESARYSASSFVHAMSRDVFKLCSYKYDGAHRLRAADKVQTGSSLVLFRRPPPPYFTRYVPARFQEGEGGREEQEEQDDSTTRIAGDTEDAQLQQLMQITADSVDQQLSTLKRTKTRKQKALDRRHPDDYEYGPANKPIPDAEYMCRACGATGEHFRHDCPLHREEGDADAPDKVKAADKIFVPTGIPKTFLQHVHEDVELNKQTMVTRDGSFVQLVRNMPKLSEDEMNIAVVPTWQDKEENDLDGGELYFDFEDYLTQVVDVREARLKAKYGPAKKIQFMCTHWLQGLCHKGVLCEYLHYYDVKFIPICKFFMEGKCTNNACPYQHVLPTSVTNQRQRQQQTCHDYAVGFCPRGPACTKLHQRRVAPCIADFEDTHVFHACVAAFEEFMETHRTAEVQAKKSYKRAPDVTKTLYQRLQKNARHK